MPHKRETERLLAEMIHLLDIRSAISMGMRAADHHIEETTRARIAESRNILAQTDHMTTGYKPTKL